MAAVATTDWWPPPLDAPQRVLPTGGVMYHAIEYAVLDGYRPLQLDLYLPAPQPGSAPAPAPTPAPAPAIVYFHGGGWAVGTRRRFGRAFKGWDPSALQLLAAAGFAVATVDYRLTGEASFPAQLHDAKAAVRWLRSNSSQLNIDTNRIVAWGESAGGHIALLVGLTGNRPELDGPGQDPSISSGVCGVVAWYPPTDLTSLTARPHPDATHDPNAPDSTESRLVGAPLASVPDAARAASPITYVHRDAPPIQLHHGTQDRVVPFQQSEALAAALLDCGASVEFIPVEGCDHFWTDVPDLRAIFDSSLAFVQQVVG
jgi:acetyl esterase/lipase